MKIDESTQLIGDTPSVHLARLFPGEHKVFLKLEKQNPGGSIKDRIALKMVEDAEKAGLLKAGGVIVEPTSGNTGIGLAMVAAIKGYKCILTMPESMSIERRKLMAAYGASVVLTPKEMGMKGAVSKAEEILATLPDQGGWMPMQFSNLSNPAAHFEATADEIIQDFPEGVDFLITGVGTGGHFSGCVSKLKDKFPSLAAFAVEPLASPILSDETAGAKKTIFSPSAPYTADGGAERKTKGGPHRLQGIGAGFIPKNFDASLCDGVITIDEEEAFKMCQRCVKKEGLFVGISTGASLAAVALMLNKLKAEGKNNNNKSLNILTFNYDTGERYMSVPGFLEIDRFAPFRTPPFATVERAAFLSSSNVYILPPRELHAASPLSSVLGTSILRRQELLMKNALGKDVQVEIVKRGASFLPPLTGEDSGDVTIFATLKDLVELHPILARGKNLLRYGTTAAAESENKKNKALVVQIGAFSHLAEQQQQQGQETSSSSLLLRPNHAGIANLGDTGALIFCSRTPQEMSDLSFAAHLASLETGLAAVHVYDDPAIANIEGGASTVVDVDVPSELTISEALLKATAAVSNDKSESSAEVAPASEEEEQPQQKSKDTRSQVLQTLFEERAEELFDGRRYGPCDLILPAAAASSSDNISTLLIVANTHAASGLIAAVGANSAPPSIGLVALRILSPFPPIQNIIPASVKKIIVVDFTSESSSTLFLQVSQAIFSAADSTTNNSNNIDVISCLVRPTFAPIRDALAFSLIDAFASGTPSSSASPSRAGDFAIEEDFELGPDVPDWMLLSSEAFAQVRAGNTGTVSSSPLVVVDDDNIAGRSSSSSSSYFSANAVATSLPFQVAQGLQVESYPIYEQVLRQSFGTRLFSPSLASVRNYLLEVGLGQVFGLIHQRKRLVEDVGQLIAKSVAISSASSGSSLSSSLTTATRNLTSALIGWVETNLDTQQNASNVERLLGAVQRFDEEQTRAAVALFKDDASSSTFATFRSQLALLSKPSLWLIGGEELQSNAGLAAVHHIIASGEDVNILIVETAPVAALRGDVVYSGKGKKDIGLYAMQFGGCYVASVAKYASYTHVLQALKEADSFRGPSIVLAYAPATTSTSTNTSSSQQQPSVFSSLHSMPSSTEALEMLRQTKQAVDEGLWPLYRFDPRRESGGGDQQQQQQDAFQLDSDKVVSELASFLDQRNQLTLLTKVEPSLPQGLTANALQTSHHQLVSSFAKMSAKFGGPPLLVLFASDTGNARECARQVAAAASQTSAAFNARHLAMDDVELADLAAETKVVFCVSTAGQGEFPANGQNLWKAIKAQETPDLFGTVEYAVFGLGDSHYWPNPGDEKYFCKPAVDLDRKLETLGGRRITPLVKGDDQAQDGFKSGFKEFLASLWSALGTTGGDIGSAGANPNALPPDDVIKAESNYLRGTIAEGLLDTSTGALSERDGKLTKFHGIYQQDDRDLREQRRQQHLEPAYSFMIRVGIPGGVCTPAQWLVIDELADEYGNGGFKLTTRQAFQFHGILKGNLKPTIQKFNRALMTSLAACGDVCRNVIANPMPHQSPVHEQVWEFSKEIQEAMRPATPAYHEIWLDKKMVAGGEMREVEPLYGKTYLPRKFKVAITVPPMNDVDVQAHCLGYVAILEMDGTVLAGYTVTVGGGMGMTHNNAKTYPRLADPLCFVRTKEQAIAVGLAVLRVQRDHGERLNRKHARLKYTVEDMGLEQFRAKVQEQVDFPLEDPRPFEFLNNTDRFGWFADQNGTWNYGCFVEHGRVIDHPHTESSPIRTALREIAQIHKGDFRLTANQGVYISRIQPEDRAAIEAILQKYKVSSTSQSALRQSSMACVALPTCALAMAESERYLPHLVTKLDKVIDECGLRNDSITIRMTGCPNGCARPYLGEIAFVGRAPGYYNLYLGAAHNGTRLNKLYKSSINEEQILAELTPLIQRYAKERLKIETNRVIIPSSFSSSSSTSTPFGEGEKKHVEGYEFFGDFVIRVGIIKASGNGALFHEFTEVAAGAK